MQWEELKSNHGIMGRAKVPGGWFVIYKGEGITMIFYPDPEHKWDGHSGNHVSKLTTDDRDP